MDRGKIRQTLLYLLILNNTGLLATLDKVLRIRAMREDVSEPSDHVLHMWNIGQ